MNSETDPENSFSLLRREPTNYKAAIKPYDAEHWIEAMNKKYQSMIDNET